VTVAALDAYRLRHMHTTDATRASKWPVSVCCVISKSVLGRRRPLVWWIMRSKAVIVLLVSLTAVSCSTFSRHTPRALDLKPEDQRFAEALAHYAQGLINEKELGTGDEATIREFERAVELDPAQHRIYSKIALGHLLRKDPAQAIATLESACRASPTDLQARTDLAITAQITGQYDLAIQAFRRVLKMDPSSTFSYVALARIYIHLQQENQAAAVLASGVGKADNQQLFVMASVRGKELVEQGKMEDAVPYFLFLLDKSDVRRRELLNLMGQIYLEVKKPEQAVEYFRRATREPAPLTDSFVKLGLIELDLGNADQAIETLREADRLSPGAPIVLFSLGIAYNSQKRYADALAVFDRIAKSADTNDQSRLTADFYLHYGATAERAGQADRAAAIFEKSLTVFPDNDAILNYLAYMWAEKGLNLTRAAGHARRALKRFPENGAYLDTLGWICFKQGRNTEALEHLQHAIQLVGDDATVNDHLGDVLNALGRTAEAIAAWRTSYLLDPDSAAVLTKLTDQGLDPKKLRHEAAKVRRKREKAAARQAQEPPPATMKTPEDAPADAGAATANP
jgi:tetratricopeptide (TPR) repeat protein